MLKKTLCLLLAALMLVGVLASCATGDTPSDTAQTNGSSDTAAESDTRETLDIPDTRYDGKELCFLTRAGEDQFTWATVEIFAENQTSESDNISNAVFERNDRILQEYGVTVTEIRKDIGEHHTAVSNEVSAPTGDFHAITTNVSNAASFSTNGFLWDLNSVDVEYMDFTKPWWDNNMAEGMSIDDRLYFATGDIMILDNDATFIIVFNKQMVVDLNVTDDLYALVENGQWTMNKFYELEQLAVQDKDGDGKLSYESDVCGFAYTQDVPYALLFGGGVTLCTKDDQDYPIYELDVDRAQSIAEMGKLIFSDDMGINMSAISINQGTSMVLLNQTAFGENHALFMSEVMQCVTRLRGFTADFGILPFPKYTAEQESYCSMMHSTASVVAIPRSVDGEDLVMANSMMEAMAYHSVDTLTEQYYEINLKTKGARDEKSGPMIDMILSGRVCDLSYYYGWGGAFGQLAGCLLPTGGKSVSSTSKSFKRSIERNIEQLMKAYSKFDG